MFNQFDSTNQGKDSSWLFSFVWTGKTYKVEYRTVDYLFESELETEYPAQKIITAIVDITDEIRVREAQGNLEKQNINTET